MPYFAFMVFIEVLSVKWTTECEILFPYVKVACGGCHTMVLANERQEDEDGLDLIRQSLDCESEVHNLYSYILYILLQVKIGLQNYDPQLVSTIQ
jgi:hypothetical protein